MTTDRISRERLEEGPGAVYTETVLEPSYRFMVRHYFDHLVETNRAWTVMLHDQGIVERSRAAALLRALDRLSGEGREALSTFNPAHEYFYSHMEHYLTEQVGEEVSGEINIGRTRPEPLTRMALRLRVLGLVERLLELQRVLLDVAERESATTMAHWTHLQTAQVTTAGHHVVGLVDAFARDVRRLLTAYHGLNVCTLGCGALAGTSYPIDRDGVARLLGFDGIRLNTNDCVGGGDYLLETTAAVANMMVTVSRCCEDFYLWHTEEFGYVEIADSFAGSSSMMPQKKNAYPFEYVRARAAHSIGHMTAAFCTLHNTNYQDIKDVEEEMVPPAFQALDEASDSLRLLAGTVATMEFRRDAMRERAETSFALTTELAAAVHRNTDLSMRTAHRVVGNLVLRAVKGGLTAREVTSDLLDASAREVLGRPLGLAADVVRAALDPEAFVRAHDVPGGPSPRRLREALDQARSRMDGDAAAVTAARERLAGASAELDRAAEAIVAAAR